MKRRSPADALASLEAYLAAVSRTYIIRYFTVPPPDSGVRLRVMLWYGYMEAGKTYSDGVLEAMLKARTGPRLYVVTNSAVHAVYELLFQRRDELKSYSYIDIFFDDALVLAHSQGKREVKVATDKVISVIRHIFSAALGRPATITLRAATQKYSILHPLLKPAPVIILKSAPNDPGDYYTLSRLFKGGSKRAYFSLLRKITAAAYLDDRWKEYAVAVISSKPKIIRISGSPAPADIRIMASIKTAPEEFSELSNQLLDLVHGSP